MKASPGFSILKWAQTEPQVIASNLSHDRFVQPPLMIPRAGSADGTTRTFGGRRLCVTGIGHA
jgi:hypothetical protein